MDKIREISATTTAVAFALLATTAAYQYIKITFFNDDKKQK